MKKACLSLLILFGFFVAVNAQNIKESKVSAAARSAFQKKFPKAKAKWEQENGSYEATFKMGGKIMSAIIDKGGTIVETETDIPVNDLPKAVTTYLKSHYKGAKIKEASRIVRANGDVQYEGLVNGKDLMFDADGKFIKEAKD